MIYDNGMQDSERTHYSKQLTKPQVQKRRAATTQLGRRKSDSDLVL